MRNLKKEAKAKRDQVKKHSRHGRRSWGHHRLLQQSPNWNHFTSFNFDELVKDLHQIGLKNEHQKPFSFIYKANSQTAQKPLRAPIAVPKPPVPAPQRVFVNSVEPTPS